MNNPHHFSRFAQPVLRNFRGSLIAEFGPALFLLIFCFVIPLLDLGMLPIRYGLTYAAATNAVSKLALANKASDANRMLQTDTWWTSFLGKCGIDVEQKQLAMVVINKKGSGQVFATDQPGSIPSALLPDGPDGPGAYILRLSIKADISPLLVMSGRGIPGLTSPVPITLQTSSVWENLGRDPDTTEYYLNE